MSTFKEANQARLSLKMKLSNYSWYMGSEIAPEADGYLVIVNVKNIDNNVKKIVPHVYKNVTIKTELD